MKRVSDATRLAARHRPDGQPVMHQNWGKLLFIHWPVNEKTLRSHIPPALQIDTFNNSAWLAITPFTMWDVRAFPPFVPAVPGFSSMHELNVRTYVHYEGVPGVWFFSLDINNPAAAFAARTFFHLPYHTAEIDLEQDGDVINYRLSRDDKSAAEFQASWTIGKMLPFSQPGSREFFLTERYVLYTENQGELYRACIHHQPWPLQTAKLEQFSSNIFAANGLPEPGDEPLLHYAEEVNVDIWFLENVGDSK